MSLIPNTRPITMWPDYNLSRKCDVIEFNKARKIFIAQLVVDMIKTMDEANGIGLAAPQVGVPIRLFIIRIEPQNTIVFINPTIEVMDDTPYEWEEGCLSVPGHFEQRERPVHVKVTYQDIEGEEQCAEFVGLYAFAIQHEYDHLEGKVFVDELSRFKKSRIKTKIKKTLAKA